VAERRLVSTRLPGLAELELLDAVARHGSMTAAAAAVGLTQQAVSLRIRAMESTLGVTLLTRSTRGAELTGAGSLLHEWSSGLLAGARDLAVAIETLRTRERAHLRIASSLTIAEHLLPNWLVTFHQHQTAAGLPPTEVEVAAINTASVLDRIRSGAAHIGFVEGTGRLKGLHARTVAEDELLIVVRPDHPWLRRRTPVPVDLLARTPLVGRESGSGSRQAFDDALEPSTAAAVRAAVAAGVGPAAISSLAIADDLLLGRVRVVPIEGLTVRRRLRAVWRGDVRPSAGPVRDLLTIALGHRAPAG
jgi:molybdate transport repressor ModE-like protein